MADLNIEVLRGVVTSHDAAIADAIKVRKELETAKAEIARLTKLIKPVTPSPVTPTPAPVIPTPTPTPATGNLVVRGRKIFRANGTEVIARGPEATIAARSRLADVDAIGATGANAMRMLLTLDAANNMKPSDFDDILTRAASYGMIVWVSLYTWNDGANNLIGEALGGGNFYSLGGGSRDRPAACYLSVWARPWLKDLMQKHRDHVVIDAAQEYKAPSGGGAVAEQEAWAVSAEVAIRFFREQGYTQPIEIMANWQGRDLAGIIRKGDRILKADTVLVDGQPQTMFGWQAYWGTADGWYPRDQGAMLAGRTLTAVEAMSQFVSRAAFPIQMGFDNYAGDTNLDWKAQMDAAATLGLSWLWWSWTEGSRTVEAPVSGAECQTYVLNSAAGFKGANKT